METLKEITKKEILYKDNYISYTKSMLHLPIFTISKNVNSLVDYEINIPKFEGFRDINLKFPPLSIKNDFMVFTYILKKFYKNCDDNIKNPFALEFSLNDFFDYFEISRSNRSAYSKTIHTVLKRLLRINLSFSRDDNDYLCNFLSSVVISDKGGRYYNIELGKNFLNLFKHDENLIFNLNLDNYKILDKEFSKILYIYYITNTHKINKKNNIAKFDINNVYTRLQSSSANHKKLEHIRAAHKELKDKKLIKGFSFSKKHQEITHINVEYYTKSEKSLMADNLELESKEEVKEEVEEVKKSSIFDKPKEIKTDISGFDDDNFIDNPKDDEIPF